MTKYDEYELEVYILFDNDMLASLDLIFMAPASVEEAEKVENTPKMSDKKGLPSLRVPLPSKIFKSTPEKQLPMFEDSRQSNSTERNTK